MGITFPLHLRCGYWLDPCGYFEDYSKQSITVYMVRLPSAVMPDLSIARSICYSYNKLTQNIKLLRIKPTNSLLLGSIVMPK